MSAPEADLVTLSNGVRLVLDPMPGLETAAVGVWIGVGARMECAAQNGIAHLFEHMAFKGAGSRDARAFAEAIEQVGGSMNAATGYERTCYYSRVTKDHVGFALDLIADIVRAPHWRADDLEKEKGVVAQERGEAFDQPDDRVFELHQAIAYPDQPMGRPILGLEETIAPLSPADLAAFRDQHMAASRIVIAASGAFDRDALIDCAQRRFGDVASFAPPPVSPARAAGGGACEVRKLEQTHLVFSWPAPSMKDEAVYAARVLSEIYGGGMASRLFQAVREEAGLVYAIDSWLDAGEDAGRIGVYAGCAGKNAKRVAAMSTAILDELCRHGPSDKELARAKAVLGAQWLMGAESPMARAEARAAQVFLRGAPEPFIRARQKLEAVTAEQVRAIAQDALAGACAGAVIGPKAGMRALDALVLG